MLSALTSNDLVNSERSNNVSIIQTFLEREIFVRKDTSCIVVYGSVLVYESAWL